PDVPARQSPGHPGADTGPHGSPRRDALRRLPRGTDPHVRHAIPRLRPLRAELQMRKEASMVLSILAMASALCASQAQSAPTPTVGMGRPPIAPPVVA